MLLKTAENRILEHLSFLYGKTDAKKIWIELQAHLTGFLQRNPHFEESVTSTESQLSQRDAILITYGNQIQDVGQPPLKTLTKFLNTYLSDSINGVHLLPFYPYSSDDGFSVIDYHQVDPALGAWEDITALGDSFKLMFDAVINHISRRSQWFKGYQRGDDQYQDYFITIEPGTDLSTVVRPRALPLLTAVDTRYGTRHVWTTFSEDQIDLNFRHPQVLLEIVDLLLFYVERGAEIIRLDAIAYLWKEVGTPSIHLPQVHHVVKLFRALLDAVAPGVILITETNVPHEENISYFGKPLPESAQDITTQRGDEAQMVYQFPLAPLVLHTFHSEDARPLTEWAASLDAPFPTATFFNFIASHDGIGVRPAEGLLSPAEIQALGDRTLAHGGQVSYKTNPDGSKSAYELNITLYDALNDPGNPQPESDVLRFLASQVIMLSMAGVPGIYIHSLFGSRNCHACVEQTGRARSINREKFQRKPLESALADPTTLTSQVFSGYTRLLRTRQAHPAFHPYGLQKVLLIHEQVFALVRTAPWGKEIIFCLVNVTPSRVTLNLEPGKWDLPQETGWLDLISGNTFSTDGGRLTLSLTRYQALWLTPEPGDS